MHLGYIIIYVADVPKTAIFYETVFALKRRFLHKISLYGEMETGGTTLAFAGTATVKMTGLANSKAITFCITLFPAFKSPDHGIILPGAVCETIFLVLNGYSIFNCALLGPQTA